MINAEGTTRRLRYMVAISALALGAFDTWRVLSLNFLDTGLLVVVAGAAGVAAGLFTMVEKGIRPSIPMAALVFAGQAVLEVLTERPGSRLGLLIGLASTFGAALILQFIALSAWRRLHP